MEKIPHGCPFTPRSEVMALETYDFYRSHRENKLGFVCTHHPEMACVDHIWSQVNTYIPLEAPSIQAQRTISPGHREHKQYLRFKQLQQTRRRAVKFWSLARFLCQIQLYFVRLGMCWLWSSDYPQITKYLNLGLHISSDRFILPQSTSFFSFS